MAGKFRRSAQSSPFSSAAGGVAYTYDGDGWRVKADQASGSTYDLLQWRGVGGEVLAESDLAGNLQREFIYYNGERIARRDADGSVYYLFADRLGSAWALTDAQGFYKDIRHFYPFGGIQREINFGVDNRYQFTGLHRDGESQLDDTLFRKYSHSFARCGPCGAGRLGLVEAAKAGHTGYSWKQRRMIVACPVCGWEIRREDVRGGGISCPRCK